MTAPGLSGADAPIPRWIQAEDRQTRRFRRGRRIKSRNHAAGTRRIRWPHPPEPRLSARHQAMAPSTSSSDGNRPTAFLEKASRPSTVISKTPPPDLRSLTSAAGRRLRIRSRAARARGS